MAKCPKCGHPLKITDIRPLCPACGANLMYFQMDQRLERDALNAEREAAAVSKFFRNMKAVSIGSVPAVLRLLAFILTIGALLLPVFQVTDGTLSVVQSESVGLLQLISAMFAEGVDIMAVLFGTKTALLCTVFFFGGALLTLVSLIVSLFSFTKHGRTRNLILWLFTFLVFAVPGTLLALGRLASLSVGFYGVMVLLIATLILHICLATKKEEA